MEENPSPNTRETRGESRSRMNQTPWKWMRSRWMHPYQKRQRERLRQDIEESRAGVPTFMTMAEYAIRLAASTEPNPDIRRTKRRDLVRHWRTYQRKLFKIAKS
jgi:hypothetical protein